MSSIDVEKCSKDLLERMVNPNLPHDYKVIAEVLKSVGDDVFRRNPNDIDTMIGINHLVQAKDNLIRSLVALNKKEEK